MALEKIEFFGAADRKGKTVDGRITSEYPAWYLDAHIDELQRDIDRNEHAIQNHLIPDNAIPDTRAELSKLKTRMAEIVNSKPKLSGKDQDRLSGIYNELKGQISDSMFTYTDMQKGLVSAHEEARRMTSPVISVGDNHAVFEQMGVTPVKGRISRNQAAKVIKIAGRLLGEQTNIEAFRKDNNYGTYHSDVPLHEVERS